MNFRYKTVEIRKVEFIDGKSVVTLRSIQVHDRLDSVTEFVDRYVLPVILALNIAGVCFTISAAILHFIMH